MDLAFRVELPALPPEESRVRLRRALDQAPLRLLQPTASRNSSIVSAVSVRIFVLPRAPRATDTRAIVAESGASTTLTKSYSPSVAHWWTTFAPSSSTSLFTSRRRSGFAFSVCTPCGVRLESRMYVAIGVPPRSGARLYSRRLIHVEDRRTQDEQRCEDDERQHGGDAQRLPAALAQREEDHEPGEEDRDRERRQRSERVHEVGTRQLHAAAQRVGISTPFDERSGNREPHEREPRERNEIDPREDPEARNAHRQKRQIAGRERNTDVAAAPDRAYERDGACV